MPVTGFDLWQKARLHETSRRRSNECGIDVVVAAATTRETTGGNNVRNKFTADEAAQELVALAKEMFPDSALAKYDEWAAPVVHHCDTRILRVRTELKNRGLDGQSDLKEQFRPYVAKLRWYPTKPKSFDEIEGRT